MATGQIDYEALQQEAMRGLVRSALQLIAKTGLPGEHHFYISFLTQAHGVILSKRLREKYPAEMTIVLQHRFWDLLVSDDRFEVKLTFDGIPERLVVPFAAIKVFIDPSVRFGLQFEDADGGKESVSGRRVSMTMDAAYDQAGEAHADSARAMTKKPRTPRKPKPEKELVDSAANSTAKPQPVPPPPVPVAPEPPRPAAAADTPPAEASEKPAGDAANKVVSLDLFRKK